MSYRVGTKPKRGGQTVWVKDPDGQETLVAMAISKSRARALVEAATGYQEAREQLILLRSYVEHDTDCPLDGPCGCGLFELLEAIKRG